MTYQKLLEKGCLCVFHSIFSRENSFSSANYKISSHLRGWIHRLHAFRTHSLKSSFSFFSVSIIGNNTVAFRIFRKPTSILKGEIWILIILFYFSGSFYSNFLRLKTRTHNGIQLFIQDSLMEGKINMKSFQLLEIIRFSSLVISLNSASNFWWKIILFSVYLTLGNMLVFLS